MINIIANYKKNIIKYKNSNYALDDEETILHLTCNNMDNILKHLNNINNNLNISSKYKCGFIHIPKTAGTTIELLLFNDNLKRTINRPNSLHENINYYNYYYDYFLFSFVRNPYTRIISIYNYYMNNGNKSKYDSNLLCKNTTLDDFLVKYNHTTIKHLRTQYSFLQNSKHINFIGRFENYNKDIIYICNKLKIDKPTINNIRRCDKTNYIITPKFINKVNEIYKIDFETYNYKILNLNKNINYKDFLKIL